MPFALAFDLENNKHDNEIMDTETKARIVEEGGKVMGDLIKALALRPRKPPEGSTSPSEIAQTAPQKENVGKTSQEPASPPTLKSETVESGKACIPCCIDHFSTCSGLLSDEAIRFARRHGIANNETIQRISACIDQLNAMERGDLAVEKIADLPDWEKDLAIHSQNQGADIRHKLTNISDIEDLEKVSVQIKNIRQKIGKEWYKRRLANLGKETKSSAPTLEEAKAEAAKLAGQEVEKLWQSREKK